MEFDGKFSMEFCLVVGHGIPWNSMKTFPWNSMEFHKNSIPWNSVWYWDMEFHGILWSSTKAQLHGILSGIRVLKSMKKYPWNSIALKLVCKEFRTTSIKIFLQPLISTELDKDFYNIINLYCQ